MNSFNLVKGNFMILTGAEIAKQVQRGKIVIHPFDEAQLNPNSYNYHLDDIIYEAAEEVVDSKKPTKFIKHKIGAQGFLLHPKKLYLSCTEEVIGSSHCVVSLIGRSSVGRLGLFLQITADLGQLGNAHAWTLELTVVQPLRVYAGMTIGQVSFWNIDGEIQDLYTAGYSQMFLPTRSKFYRELAS